MNAEISLKDYLGCYCGELEKSLVRLSHVLDDPLLSASKRWPLIENADSVLVGHNIDA